MGYIEQVAPGIVPVIRELDALARTRSEDPAVAVIDGDDVVHMAAMDVHFSHAVNGVAALHTQILVESEMRPFAELYPDKFSNKTNGITFRRWLMGCNPALAALLTDAIGDGWVRDASKLEGLLALSGDAGFVQRLLEVKEGNKERLAAWLRAEKNVEVDPHSVFDIQVKRMHQYKRQQMNALYAIWKYLQVKRGETSPTGR